MVEHDSIFGAAAEQTLGSPPIGEYLRRQRILRGMSAEELADLTRIPLRSLERLESGQFDGETDGFVRGFVRTVAAALGLDTDDAVSRMLSEPSASAWERHAPGRSTKQALAIATLVLCLAFLALGLRMVWSMLLGDASGPSSREVFIWQDPVRLLAEATGLDVDPAAGIGPRELAQDGGAPAAATPPRDPFVDRPILERQGDGVALAP